jgi:DNA-binding CsgD family transcriptional regulator
VSGQHVRALHPAERKYLLDAARGYTAQQTAKRYGVSTNTVNTALKHGKTALGARNIAHAVSLCLVLGEWAPSDVLGDDLEGKQS